MYILNLCVGDQYNLLLKPEYGVGYTKMGSDLWFVYMVRCSDNSLYTGIATNVERRIDEHNKGDKSGAKYTRPRRPVKLVYQEKAASRSEAASREAVLKKLTKKEKEALVRK
jgi:putative endonuclease